MQAEPAACWFLVLPVGRLIFNGLHNVLTQKIELYTVQNFQQDVGEAHKRMHYDLFIVLFMVFIQRCQWGEVIFRIDA
jgi:hypothetical protein